jgi:hypothetical protein
MSRQAPPSGVGFNVFPVAKGLPHDEYADGTCTDECFATHPDHAESRDCEACGAEAGEPCGFGCLGYALEHGDL